jgi:hypothetical protein
MHPPASVEHNTAIIVPAIGLRIPIAGICARRAGLVKSAMIISFPRFRGAE